MKYIKRSLQDILENWLFKGKILTIMGARQVGKTTLAREILKKYGNEKDYYNCDIISIRQSLQKQDPLILKKIIGDSKLIVIDEAQRIENIGLVLKILHDSFPEIQILATGSSSFELSNKINEPLTGRALEFKLFPFSINELSSLYSVIEIEAQLDFFLRFGQYPDIIQKDENDARVLLDNLASKYLYKDILEFEEIKKPDVLLKLLQLISFQLGHEVSKNELSTKLSVNRDTIDRYLDLLEKAYVIYRLKPFSRNLRKEINKKEKIFFYDLGIRNSLISAYNPIEFREDIGALWENFCIVERMKFLQSVQQNPNSYFWRTHDKKEIDYLEEYNGKITGYEFKWQKNKMKIPAEFLETYKNSSIAIINKNNFWDLFS